MNKIDLATRAFNTPLMLDPAKAAVIAQVLGPRLPGVGSEAEVRIVGVMAEPEARHMQSRPQAASILGDEVHHAVKRRGGGYSNIQGVAVIPVLGSLVRRGSYVGAESGVTSYEGLSAQIRAAAEDDEVRVIALEIDSFGGEADGIFDLGAQIREARDVKPVHAFLADHALSAGYAIASQADRITIPPFGYAGSIGVVSMHVDQSGQLDKAGLKVTLVHSGAHKVDGNPLEPLPDAVRGEMQKEGDEMWLAFAQMVEQGRRGKVSMQQALQTEAAVFRGKAALDIGLVDQVAEARAAFKSLVDEANPTIGPVGQVVLGQNVAFAAKAASAIPSHSAIPSSLAGIDMLGPRSKFNATNGPQTETGSSGCAIGAMAPSPEEADMPDKKKSPDAEVQTASNAPATQAAANGAVVESSPDDATRAVSAERERASKISAKVSKMGLPQSLAQLLIDDGTSYSAALEKIIDARADAAEDGGDIANVGGTAKITSDGHDKLCQGLTKALLGKAGMDGGERNEFTGMQLREMARVVLVSQGGRVPMGGAMQLAGAAFAPASAGAMHTTSDFGNILADVANKSMLKGFEEAPETFERFTSVGTLGDFKPHKRVGLDSFPSLREVREGAEFKYVSLGDHAESAVLGTYGEMFAITRQTVINDDLSAFTTIPMKMGRAARRTVGDLIFAVLTGNPDMSDGNALFHSAHKNLASSGAAPSEATVNAAITAMATQLDRAGKVRLNIEPSFLLAPPKWRSAVLQTLNSEYAPDDTSKSGTAKMPRAYNTVRDAAEPLFDARIGGDNWFMLADPSMYDTIEVGYLDGIDTPFLDEQEGWSVDGTEYKVRIDAAATPLAWQGLYKNAGS